jgi:hypothetical protein
MKLFRFFAIFAVVLTLVVTFSTPSLAQFPWLPNNGKFFWQANTFFWQNKNSCVVRKWDRAQPRDVFPELPANSVLQFRPTHVAVITTTEEEFNFQQKAFENAGFGPWLTPVSVDVPATYCGRLTQLQAEISLSQDFQTTPSYLEIFRIYGKKRTFFSDFHKINGPSLAYFGLEALPGVSYEQVLAFLREQNIPVVFHAEALGVAIDLIRIGYAYGEIVTPLSTTN